MFKLPIMSRYKPRTLLNVILHVHYSLQMMDNAKIYYDHAKTVIDSTFILALILRLSLYHFMILYDN